MPLSEVPLTATRQIVEVRDVLTVNKLLAEGHMLLAIAPGTERGESGDHPYFKYALAAPDAPSPPSIRPL